MQKFKVSYEGRWKAWYVVEASDEDEAQELAAKLLDEASGTLNVDIGDVEVDDAS